METLLDKPFDELTAEEWELFKGESDEDEDEE